MTGINDLTMSGRLMALPVGLAAVVLGALPSASRSAARVVNPSTCGAWAANSPLGSSTWSARAAGAAVTAAKSMTPGLF
jgi:hypothetical protein